MFLLVKEGGFNYEELLRMEIPDLHAMIKELADYNQRVSDAYKESAERLK